MVHESQNNSTARVRGTTHNTIGNNSVIIQQLICFCMIDGNKSQAVSIVLKAFTFFPKQCVAQAVHNVQPSLHIRKIRKAGSTLLVPCTLSLRRQRNLALRWLVEAARKTHKSNSMAESLADELMNAFHKTGTVWQKRQELHRLAEANRAFAHYRWWGLCL